MKKLPLFLFALSASFLLYAQAPRYVLLEHFTNSRCSICAGRNPAFYNAIDDYPVEIHHISIHPPVPYNNCVFYLANTQENNAWATYYGIFGTPRVAVNGNLIPPGNPLLPAATLQAALGQTSNVHVKVEEGGNNTNRVVTIQVTMLEPLPPGDYRLFAAVAEKTINLQTPNGEPVHHDVFRDMLPNMNGQSLPASGMAEFEYDYQINPAWNPDEIYVVAFVRNMDTGEVLNSGTKFDPEYTSTRQVLPQTVRIWPNPAAEEARVQLPLDEQVEQVEVLDLSGRRSVADYALSSGSLDLSLAGLSQGIYLVRVTGQNAVYQGKLVKQ